MDLLHVVRSFGSMPHIFTGGVPAERAGDERLAFRKLRVTPGGPLVLGSASFRDGDPIPRIHTADGGEVRPMLEWSGLPKGTVELALLVEDPDAPTPNPFVHWAVHGIEPRCTTISEALASGAREGRTTLMKSQWLGCAPPRGDLPHRYFFQLFALARRLHAGAHAGRNALLSSLRGNLLGCAVLVGTYQR